MSEDIDEIQEWDDWPEDEPDELETVRLRTHPDGRVLVEVVTGASDPLPSRAWLLIKPDPDGEIRWALPGEAEDPEFTERTVLPPDVPRGEPVPTLQAVFEGGPESKPALFIAGGPGQSWPPFCAHIAANREGLATHYLYRQVGDGHYRVEREQVLAP